MKPTSETGWWIVTYTIVLVRPSEDPPRSIPNQVLRKQVMVRCEHWREAFMKARRIGIDDELADADKGRWQYMGINDLIPLPEKNEDGFFLGEERGGQQSGITGVRPEWRYPSLQRKDTLQFES